MDERLEAETNDLRDLFEHPGWTVLVRETKRRLDAFREGFPFNVSTLEQLYFARGMVATLTELLNMQTLFSQPEPQPESDD